jgi:hypothetical protein
MAHFGAALLAAWWLERDAELSKETAKAMTQQADAMMAKHSWLFTDHSGISEPGRIDDIVDALDGGLNRCWAIGHDVIFAALTLRTLDARPDLGSSWIVESICNVIRGGRTFPLETIGNVFDVRDVPDYDEKLDLGTTVVLAKASLEAMLDFDHIYEGPHQGDVGHIADHAHGLLSLERLGYENIARQGLGGFREHLAALQFTCHMIADLPEIFNGLQVGP